MKPGGTYDDIPLSTFEEIDPERSSRSAFAPRRELILGLLVVFIALGWAGWQWWQQAANEQAYQAAQQAATALLLEDALARFSAISGFKDSDVRTAQIQRTISERDTQYEAATEHAQAGEWVASLQAARAVDKLQPNFADNARVEANAERNVYESAIYGAVAMRTQANPPGLYYRDRDSWVWLKGSDEASELFYKGQLGQYNNIVLYDVPAGASPFTQTSPLSTNPGGIVTPDKSLAHPELKDRRLVAVRLSAEGLLYFPLMLDPTRYALYRWGPDGVWAFPGSWPFGADPGGDSFIYFSSGIVYEPFELSHVFQIVLPGSDWKVLALSPVGDRMLLAESVVVNSDWQTRIYSADLHGSPLKLIYTGRGFNYSAQFSPRSDYVLLTSRISEINVDTTRISLLDLIGSSSPVVLAEKKSYWGIANYFEDETRASFLNNVSSPSGEGVLIFDRTLGSKSVLTLLDPSDPSGSQLKIPVEAGVLDAQQIDNPIPQALIMLALSVVTGSTPGEQSLFGPGHDQEIIVQMPSNLSGKVQQMKLQPDGFSGLQRAWIRGGKLVLQTASGNAIHLATMPVASLGNEDARPTTIYSMPDESGSIPFGSPDFNWTLGTETLAYAAQNVLHVRSLDGAIDIPLEQGVSQLYDAWR